MLDMVNASLRELQLRGTLKIITFDEALEWLLARLSVKYGVPSLVVSQRNETTTFKEIQKIWINSLDSIIAYLPLLADVQYVIIIASPDYFLEHEKAFSLIFRNFQKQWTKVFLLPIDYMKNSDSDCVIGYLRLLKTFNDVSILNITLDDVVTEIENFVRLLLSLSTTEVIMGSISSPVDLWGRKISLVRPIQIFSLPYQKLMQKITNSHISLTKESKIAILLSTLDSSLSWHPKIVIKANPEVLTLSAIEKIVQRFRMELNIEEHVLEWCLIPSQDKSDLVQIFLLAFSQDDSEFRSLSQTYDKKTNISLSRRKTKLLEELNRKEIFIFDEGGLMLGHYVDGALTNDSSNHDPALISGLVSALSMFANDVIGNHVKVLDTGIKKCVFSSKRIYTSDGKEKEVKAVAIFSDLFTPTDSIRHELNQYLTLVERILTEENVDETECAAVFEEKVKKDHNVIHIKENKRKRTIFYQNKTVGAS